MKKTGIFYGSTNGDTESVANKIAIQLGIGHLFGIQDRP